MSNTTLPSRLHHTAFVTKDLEATRKFYEEVIGLPLMATWCEADELFGAVRTYAHCFFGLGDGSALAFFQFASDEDQALFGPDLPPSPFRHIALNVDEETQNQIQHRITEAGYTEPDTFVLEHGYCRSLYITDPNGMIVEFTLDAPNADELNAQRRETAHIDLKRWLGGDHTSNNLTR